MTAWKVLTHDFRPPIQGGDLVFDGSTPFHLPPVDVDETDEECGAGWNACHKLSDALRIAGLWRDGRPSTAWMVTNPVDPVVERGNKIRAASWTIERSATEDEVVAAIREIHAPFGEHQDAIVEQVLLWRHALARPHRDAAVVVAGLQAALDARGLAWGLKRFDTAGAVRAASAARAAGDAWDTWAASAAGAARDAWDSWAAWAAGAARDALIAWYAATKGWIERDPMLLTTGLRDAYEHGLEIVLPVSDGGKTALGYAIGGAP